MSEEQIPGHIDGGSLDIVDKSKYRDDSSDVQTRKRGEVDIKKKSISNGQQVQFQIQIRPKDDNPRKKNKSDHIEKDKSGGGGDGENQIQLSSQQQQQEYDSDDSDDDYDDEDSVDEEYVMDPRDYAQLADFLKKANAVRELDCEACDGDHDTYWAIPPGAKYNNRKFEVYCPCGAVCESPDSPCPDGCYRVLGRHLVSKESDPW